MKKQIFFGAMLLLFFIVMIFSIPFIIRYEDNHALIPKPNAYEQGYADGCKHVLDSISSVK